MMADIHMIRVVSEDELYVVGRHSVSAEWKVLDVPQGASRSQRGTVDLPRFKPEAVLIVTGTASSAPS